MRGVDILMGGGKSGCWVEPMRPSEWAENIKWKCQLPRRGRKAAELKVVHTKQLGRENSERHSHD